MGSSVLNVKIDAFYLPITGNADCTVKGAASRPVILYIT